MNKKECIDGIIKAIGLDPFRAAHDKGVANMPLTDEGLNALRLEGIQMKDLWDHRFLGEKPSLHDPLTYLDVEEVLRIYSKAKCVSAILEAVPDILTKDRTSDIYVLDDKELEVIHAAPLGHGNLDAEGLLASYRNDAELMPCGALKRSAVREAAAELGLVAQVASAR